jgi:ADP-ribosyl-[dinitrogen reductase] hydrolase
MNRHRDFYAVKREANPLNDTLDRFRSCLLGLAVGDAVGTTLEFQPRGSFTPIADMVGDGPFHLQPGQWTDDTSMALCLATSLVCCRGFDARDQMQRYWHWYREGYLSSTGTCFDIGGTTRSALERFHQTGDPMAGSTDPYSAGNGSLMRLAPVPMYYFSSRGETLCYAAQSSATTHAAAECIEACQLFADMLVHAMNGEEKEAILTGSQDLPLQTEKIRSIASDSYRTKERDEIKGTGYVVDCLEASLWCFQTSGSFKDAILLAANLGDDADTTAAVCGQIAGAYYGMKGIPARWLERLHMRREIEELAEQLWQWGRARENTPMSG